MARRILKIDVCDYTNTVVCPIYDSETEISGQAFDVFVTYERNGWKQVSFTLPTKCQTEDGEEDNFRLNYIIADYRLRVRDKKGDDWYLITEEGVKHEHFSKNVNVTAGHISQLLKNRGLDLEFSDEEGNNVGTADQFLDTILDGTGWKPGNVAEFYEDDGKTIKIRSMNAGVKTGAFRLIEQMSELFEAKPVYNGNYTVDLLPMNPFSDLEEGEIPEAVYPNASQNKKYMVDSNVIELHYDKSIKNFERTRNTENISTRLYGYGSYGDTVSGLCSIQTAQHTEWVFILPKAYTGLNEFEITDSQSVRRYFQATDLSEGDKLIWSMLDYTSRKYVWNDTKRVAYHLYEDAVMDYVQLEGEKVDVVNYFPFLSDYTYYQKVGLLTEDTFQKVAAYQRDMVDHYKRIIDRQNDMNTSREQLSLLGTPYSGYLKLDIESSEQTTEGTKLTIRWSDEHPDGVIYRTDYLYAEKDYFRWYVADKLKANGDPVHSPASVVYVIHNTTPMTWDRAWLKDIDGRTYTDAEGVVHPDDYDYALSDGDKPKIITLWSNMTVNEGDSVYLFCADGFSGKLGPFFSSDEAAVQNLEEQTKSGETVHPTYFINEEEDLPEIQFTTYGWCYRYNRLEYEDPGTLYFCWAGRGDTEWKNVYFQTEEPEVEDGAYFFNSETRVLWHGETDQWIKLESVEEQRVANFFSVVHMYGRKRDKMYKGMYDYYYYTTPEELPLSQYAIYSAFGYYWLFSTKQVLAAGDTLKLDTIEGCVYQDNNVEHIVSCKNNPADTLTYPEENDVANATFFEGSVVYGTGTRKDGNDASSDEYVRSNYIPIHPNEAYNYSLPDNSVIVLYDANRYYLSYIPNLSGRGTFTTKVDVKYSNLADSEGYAQYKEAKYLKIVIPKSSIDDFILDYEEEEYEDEDEQIQAIKEIERQILRIIMYRMFLEERNIKINTSERAGSYLDYIKYICFIQLSDYGKCVFQNDDKYMILSPITHDDGEPTGISYLIKRFKEVSDTMYEEQLPLLQEAQQIVKDANAAQAEALGDILREGWWQDDSYVEGDEQRMYNDTLDNLKEIAKPEVNYTFDFLDLYGSNKDKEYSLEELYQVEWPDIEITDAAHLVDPEIGINQWGYFEKLSKCFDQPWKTTLDVNTKLSLMGNHEFTDVMTRIAEVASETKAKQCIYKRAEIISSEGTVSAEALSGEIDTNEVKVTGTGWRTDDKGNMLLETADGMAAMMFNGSGLFIANSKSTDGDWQWNRMGDGYGIDASSITSGTLDGMRIKPGSITVDKIMANVGNVLDIGSNKGLALYATTDGVKPTGSLKTTDGIIEINAGEKNNGVVKPATINIASGGELNLRAGAQGDKGASINIESQGSLNLKSGGSFTVESGNFGLDEKGNVTIGGTISSNEAVLGGWHISDEHIGNAATMDNSSVGLHASTNSNDVVIWAGKTDRDTAPFKVTAKGSVEANDMNITGGSFVMYKDVVHEGQVMSVPNVLVDNSGLKIGRTSVENATYNFYVDAEGVAHATGLEIIEAQGSLTGSLGAGSTVNEAKVSNSTLTGNTIQSGTVTGAEINDCTINGGELHLGPVENEVRTDNFAVDNQGAVTIKKGTINLGPVTADGETTYQFAVANDGTCSVNKGSINIQGTNQGFSLTGEGKTTITGGDLKGTFDGTTTGTITGTVTANSGSKVGKWQVDSDGNLFSAGGTVYLNALASTGESTDRSRYSFWGGHTDPTNDDCKFYIKKDGQAMFKKTVYASSFDSTSSREVKENIKPLALREAFDQVEPVSFQYKNDSDTHFGFIWEDLVDLYPEVCHENNNQKTIAYQDMIAVLVKEVQELKKRVAELERK